MRSEQCVHGRVVGHVCLRCETGTAEAYEMLPEPNDWEVTYRRPSGCKSFDRILKEHRDGWQSHPDLGDPSLAEKTTLLYITLAELIQTTHEALSEVQETLNRISDACKR